MESYYRDQAALCAKEAETTTLAQVRARCQRSQAAWLDMADRAARAARAKVIYAENKAS